MGQIFNKSQAIIIERTIGDDIFETMSSGLAKDYYTSVIEFICNGHDAGAHNFSIVASLDQLVMEDDGRGMDQASIHNFFTKGTDYKRINPETEEGRKVLGRFGLATLLLRHLGDAYRLETWREGTKTVVEQDFAKNGWKNPKTEVLKSDEKIPSGTRITITKPRYKLNSEQFNLDKLRSEITWGFPPLHDFTIAINGQEVQKRAITTYGVEYDATSQISDEVRIAGSIFYNSNASKKLPFNKGIILYVNGRKVGDSQDFGLASIDSRFPRNILGLIDVHGLSNKIRFDRSGFLRTADYLNIKEHITTILQSMRTDLDLGFGYKGYYQAKRIVHYIEQTLDAATERLNSKLKLEGENQYTLEFDTGERSGPIARVDNNSKIIYINQTNPQLVGASTRRASKTLENLLIMAAIVAIAEHEVSQKYSRATSVFSNLDSQIVGVSVKLFEGYQTINADLRTVKKTDNITPVSELYINPYRLYTVQDIVKLTGLDINAIKLLILCGTLEADRYDEITKIRKVRGDKVRAVLPQLEGYIPAAKLATPKYWNRDWRRYSYNFQLDRALSEHVGTTDYLKNVGKIQPFILVKKGYEQQFLEFVHKFTW